MASRGHMLQHGQIRRATQQEADVTKRFAFVQSIQIVTGGDTGLAARAEIQVDFECVLLAASRLRRGNERFVARATYGDAASSWNCANRSTAVRSDWTCR